MASRFYDCICGKFATIDVLGWLCGYKWIHCQCGRKLKSEGVFGFTLENARFAWKEYILREARKAIK